MNCPNNKHNFFTTEWAQENGVESGVTTLYAENAIIDNDGNILELPADGDIQVIVVSCELIHHLRKN
jgi:hypothetical protein